jgi:transcriptional regulator with XRE-family HTH domain
MASSTVPTGATDDGAPPITEVTTRAELGLHLTELRRRSSYSLRDLAAAIGSSPSTLSGWCRAENLPFPSQHEVFRDMLRTLGVDDPEPWMAALVRVRDGIGAREPAGDPPYQGLESFGPRRRRPVLRSRVLVRQAHDRWRAIARRPGGRTCSCWWAPRVRASRRCSTPGLRPQLEADGARLLDDVAGVPRSRGSSAAELDAAPAATAPDGARPRAPRRPVRGAVHRLPGRRGT